MVNHIDKLNTKNKSLLSIVYKKTCAIFPLLENSPENIGVVI